ncbi:TetR/AcrR family transcriptional regulator [Streptomyces sp. NBC_00249]|uniref:TetR/AcrR family transcriptional regulator n=1 Tax=Streptomyces sp. NBC_00249 TaxID=2975690 RepID=UPI00224E1EEA|nr:TetR/AcrR family transcriptional regulator [Streptomyces sp. NBC_00249]MCX5199559.1 TetR/AcrR family transcriptional regulator [Streptomyces sp. NBC_00249]
MANQQRAVRSRDALVRAAASHFDQDGYAGTSLSQISKSAGISVGGLTFHFKSKAELAEAVEKVGRADTRAALERVRGRPGPALRQLVDLTLELARQIGRNAAVRATIRLERERPGAQPWSATWLPTARELLRQARDDGGLFGETDAEAVTALVVSLVSATEMASRRPAGPSWSVEGAVALLENTWRLILVGILADRETVGDVTRWDPVRGAG